MSHGDFPSVCRLKDASSRFKKQRERERKNIQISVRNSQYVSKDACCLFQSLQQFLEYGSCFCDEDKRNSGLNLISFSQSNSGLIGQPHRDSNQVSHPGFFQLVALPFLGYCHLSCGSMIAAPAPTIRTAFQQVGKEEDKLESDFLNFKDRDQKWHTMLPLICHWLEFSGRVPPSLARESGK